MNKNRQRKPPSALPRASSTVAVLTRTTIALTLVLVLSLGGCKLFGGDGSDDDDDGTLTDAVSVLSEVVTALNGVPSAKSLTTTSAVDTVTAQANVDYGNLSVPYSPAYETLNFHVNALLTNVDGIVKDLDVFREQIDSVDMEPDEPYEDPPNEAGNVLKMKYTTVEKKVEGNEHTYFIFTMGEFDSSDKPLGGIYLEVTELPDDAGLRGMCMSVDYGSAQTARHKVAFDTAEGSVTSYAETDVAATDGIEEQGKVRVVPDPNNPESGVELALKYKGDAYGEITQTAWATDEYGGVVEHRLPADSSQDPRAFAEGFVVGDGGDAAVAFRLVGDPSPQVLFEPVYLGRDKADTPSDDFWSGGTLNVYSDSYTAPEDSDELAPQRLLVQYDDSSSDTSQFSVYAATGDDKGTPPENASPVFENPSDSDTQADALDRLFWLEGTGTSLEAGDAVYYPLDFVTDGDTVTREFYKLTEVPETAKLFGYEHQFYFQDLVPLKYLTGSFSNDNTIIQIDEDVPVGDGESEDRYYIDSNGDGSFATIGQIASGEKPDIQLMVWEQQESYYSEEEEKEVNLSAVPWVIGGELPDDLPLSDANVTYTYDAEASQIGNHLEGLLNPEGEDYFTDTTVDPFTVHTKAWKDIKASDF